MTVREQGLDNAQQKLPRQQMDRMPASFYGCLINSPAMLVSRLSIGTFWCRRSIDGTSKQNLKQAVELARFPSHQKYKFASHLPIHQQVLNYKI